MTNEWDRCDERSRTVGPSFFPHVWHTGQSLLKDEEGRTLQFLKGGILQPFWMTYRYVQILLMKTCEEMFLSDSKKILECPGCLKNIYSTYHISYVNRPLPFEQSAQYQLKYRLADPRSKQEFQTKKNFTWKARMSHFFHIQYVLSPSKPVRDCFRPF